MKITYASLEIKPMKRTHISPCTQLWVKQFNEANKILDILPIKWREDTSILQTYLDKHIEKNQAIIAYSYGELVGFMAYNWMMFHGENTVISPIIGHASIPENQAIIYRQMYRYLANIWVKNGALNHIITTYTSDKNLIETLFQLGFGVYVIDAFRRNDPARVFNESIPSFYCLLG